MVKCVFFDIYDKNFLDIRIKRIALPWICFLQDFPVKRLLGKKGVVFLLDI
jgi:hypothetical protein